MYLKFNDEVVEPPLSGPSELMGQWSKWASCILPHHKQSEETITCGSFMTDSRKIFTFRRPWLSSGALAMQNIQDHDVASLLLPPGDDQKEA